MSKELQLKRVEVFSNTFFLKKFVKTEHFQTKVKILTISVHSVSAMMRMATSTPHSRTGPYNKKTHFKTKVVLDALEAGISVLFIDSDSVVLRDPKSLIKQYKWNTLALGQAFDLATSQERINGHLIHCSGMYFANPTVHAIDLHKKMILKQQKEGKSNQLVMNDLIKQMKQLKIAELDPKGFYDGLRYFSSCCSFAHDKCCPRSEAAILHNNFAVTL